MIENAELQGRYLFLDYLAHRDVLEGNQSSWKSCIWYK